MELKEKIDLITKILGSITALIVAFVALLGKLKEVIEKILKPLAKLIGALCFCSLFYGIVIYALLHWTILNAKLFRQPIVLLQIILITTFTISVYSFIWGRWIYPWVCSWFNQKASPHQNEQNNKNQQPTQEAEVNKL